MIKASKKRNTEHQKRDIFGFHKGIARRKHWEQKLYLASIIAASIAFLLWLFAVTLPYRIAIVLISFLAALALPVKSTVDWAFVWIAKSIGLSYETALEYQDKDDFGFNESLNQRVKTLSIKLEKPKHSNWWLPIIALAIGFSLLPFSPMTGKNVWSGFQKNNSEINSELFDTKSETAQLPQEKSLEENPDLESLSSNAAENSDNAGEDQNEGLSDGYSEEEALSDYLDKISDSKKPSSDSNSAQDSQKSKNPFSSIEQPEARAEKPGDGSRQQEAGRQQTDAEAEKSENSQQDSSASTESMDQASSDEEKSGQSSSEGQEQGDNDSNNSQNNDNTETEQDTENKDSPSQGDQKQNGQNENEQGSPQQSTNPNDPQADQELGAGEKGKDGVDNKPSAEVEGDTPISTIAAEQREEEFLEGQLGRGQSKQAGQVRMTGSRANRGDPSANNSNFNRSQEEAITEGNIPLEYQEIIKKYFE